MMPIGDGESMRESKKSIQSNNMMESSYKSNQLLSRHQSVTSTQQMNSPMIDSVIYDTGKKRDEHQRPEPSHLTSLNSLLPHQKPYNGGTQPIKVIVNVKQLTFEEKLMIQTASKTTSLQIIDSKTIVLCHLQDEQKKKQTLQKEKIYQFDYVQDEQADNQMLFKRGIASSINRFIKGINQSIILIGCEGSGKKRTMIGTMRDPGIFMLTLKETFEILYESPERVNITLKISLYYNSGQHFYDLLVSHKHPLKLCEKENGEATPLGVSEVILTNMLTALKILKIGLTKLVKSNLNSDEGNIVLCLNCERSGISFFQQETSYSSLKIVKLCDANFFNEEAREGREENIMQNINEIARSLSQTTNKKKWTSVNFRSNVFSQYLKESLIGNSQTTIVCCVNNTMKKAYETAEILRIGSMLQKIMTNPKESNKVSVNQLNMSCGDVIDRIQFTLASWVKEFWGVADKQKDSRVQIVMKLMKALEKALKSLLDLLEQSMQINLIRNALFARVLDLHCTLYSLSITSEDIKEFYIAKMQRHANANLEDAQEQFYPSIQFVLQQIENNKDKMIKLKSRLALIFNFIIQQKQPIQPKKKDIVIKNNTPKQQADNRELDKFGMSAQINLNQGGNDNSTNQMQNTNRMKQRLPFKIQINTEKNSNPQSSQINTPLSMHNSIPIQAGQLNSKNLLNLPSNSKGDNSHRLSHTSFVSNTSSSQNNQTNQTQTKLTSSDLDKYQFCLKFFSKLQNILEDLVKNDAYIPQNMRRNIAQSLKDYKFFEKSIQDERLNSIDEQHRYSSPMKISVQNGGNTGVRNSVFKLLYINQIQQSLLKIPTVQKFRSSINLTQYNSFSMIFSLIDFLFQSDPSLPKPTGQQGTEQLSSRQNKLNEEGKDEVINDDRNEIQIDSQWKKKDSTKIQQDFQDDYDEEDDDEDYYAYDSEEEDNQEEQSNNVEMTKMRLNQLQLQFNIKRPSKNDIFVNSTKLSFKTTDKIVKLFPSRQQSMANLEIIKNNNFSNGRLNSMGSLTGQQQYQNKSVQIIPSQNIDLNNKSQTYLNQSNKNKSQISSRNEQSELSKRPEELKSNNKLKVILLNTHSTLNSDNYLFSAKKQQKNQDYFPKEEEDEFDLVESLFTQNTRYSSQNSTSKQPFFFANKTQLPSNSNQNYQIFPKTPQTTNPGNIQTSTTQFSDLNTSSNRCHTKSNFLATTSRDNSLKNKIPFFSSQHQNLSLSSINFFKPANNIPKMKKFPKVVNSLISQNIPSLSESLSQDQFTKFYNQ